MLKPEFMTVPLGWDAKKVSRLCSALWGLSLTMAVHRM